LDHLTREVTSHGTLSYAYDAAGRRTTMAVAGQTPVTYVYDAADRPTQIAQGSAVVTITYDTAGRRANLTLPSGVVTTYTYDAGSQLTALTYQRGAALLGTLTYTYDAAGNRVQVGGSWVRTALPRAVASATYDATDQLLTFADKPQTFDANGNLTSDGALSYTWNARGQLAALKGPGLTASFTYDALGRRQSKKINTATTQFLYDGLNPVQELNGNTVVANILTNLAIDEYLTRTTTAGTRSFVADALGSTIAMTDPTGAVPTQYTYEPFGAAALAGIDTNAFQFTGRENDGTGLYYYRARYYHPGLARFITEDPLRSAHGTNLYQYAGDSPLQFSDPFGLCLVEVRFSEVAFGAYHSYVLTTDPSGMRHYYRGGPTNEFPGGSTRASSGSSSGRAGSRKDGSAPMNRPWGPIRTWHGEYVPGTPDWDPGLPPSLLVLNNNESCGAYDRRFAQVMEDIRRANIPYRLLSTNSNAVATKALIRSGFTPGAPPVRAPGWNTPLP
jgi:RHS repeat-associated protein